MNQMHDDHLTHLLRSLERQAEPDPVFVDRLFGQLSAAAARPARGGRSLFVLLAATLMLVAIGGGVALGSGVIKLPGLSRDPLPAPSSSSNATPTPALASATPSTHASSTPTPPAPITLAADQIVQSAVNGLTVRRGTGLTGEKLGTLAAGQQAFVIGGPREADGYNWYQLSGIGLPPDTGCVSDETNPFACPIWIGWAASADVDGAPWLEQSTTDCPSAPMNVQDLAFGLSDIQRLTCYGDSRITFRGWWPVLPADAGLGGTCGVSDATPRWLACQNINYVRLAISPTDGGTGLLAVYIDPATGVEMPERGRWVEVSAHLDDPAAQLCYDPDATYDAGVDPAGLILGCRGRLAVDSAKVVDGPY